MNYSNADKIVFTKNDDGTFKLDIWRGNTLMSAPRVVFNLDTTLLKNNDGSEQMVTLKN